MEVKTDLGSVTVSDDIAPSLVAKNDSKFEIERVIRCAMQASMENTSVAYRIAVSEIVARSILECITTDASNATVDKLREIVNNIPISAMVGRCGWKSYEEASAGLYSALT